MSSESDTDSSTDDEKKISSPDDEEKVSGTEEDVKEKSIKPEEGYKQLMSLANTQEDWLFRKTFKYEGGWFCKEGTEEGVNDCYLDYGKRSGFGTPSKINSTVLATDYDNWAVTYACRDRMMNTKTEFVWIASKLPTLSEEKMKEAREALTKIMPDFDLSRLI